MLMSEQIIDNQQSKCMLQIPLGSEVCLLFDLVNYVKQH